MQIVTYQCVSAADVLTETEITEIASSNVSWGNEMQRTLIDPSTLLVGFDSARLPFGISLVCLELKPTVT